MRRFLQQIALLSLVTAFTVLLMVKTLGLALSLWPYCFRVVHWVLAGCCYVLPQHFSPSPRGRAFGSVVLIGILAIVEWLVLVQLRAGVSDPVVAAPLISFATFCTLEALIPSPRKALFTVALCAVSSFVYFACLWSLSRWSFERETFALVLPQLVPFVGMVVVLSMMDRLTQGIGFTPRHSLSNPPTA